MAVFYSQVSIIWLIVIQVEVRFITISKRCDLLDYGTLNYPEFGLADYLYRGTGFITNL